jgi:hypothetical protein
MPNYHIKYNPLFIYHLFLQRATHTAKHDGDSDSEGNNDGDGDNCNKNGSGRPACSFETLSVAFHLRHRFSARYPHYSINSGRRFETGVYREGQ